MKGKTNSQVGGTDLTLIWVGFLKVRFALEEGEITPCLNFFRNVNFVGSLILLRTAFFFAKNLHFLAKIVPLLKAIVWELSLR